MATPISKKLAKGEILFREGDPSNAMYYVQAGTIRLFKNKNAGSVELGTIRSGEVIGEMGFLDRGYRSASAEAMQEVDLLEITNANLEEQIKEVPQWIPVLLRTIVNRLRSANNKIRQLETASIAYTYGSDGISASYQFLNTYDVMKICTALLLVSSRTQSNSTPEGICCPLQKISRYANQIMGIHQSKIIELMDILERTSLVSIERPNSEKFDIYVKNPAYIETFLHYLNEENLKEHSKKVIFSTKAVKLMGLITRHLSLFPSDKEGNCDVNLAKIAEIEKTENGGKEPFEMDDMKDLIKNKIASELAVKDGQTILTKIQAKTFPQIYRIHRVIKEIDAVNEQKKEQTKKAG